MVCVFKRKNIPHVKAKLFEVSLYDPKVLTFVSESNYKADEVCIVNFPVREEDEELHISESSYSRFVDSHHGIQEHMLEKKRK